MCVLCVCGVCIHTALSSSHHFHVDFFSTNDEVQFEVTWIGERINQISQVVIAIFILVFVYVLIGLEVGGPFGHIYLHLTPRLGVKWVQI